MVAAYSDIGFTGTHKRTTNIQLQHIEAVLKENFKRTDSPSFHHGDCVEADAKVAYIALQIGYIIHCHPPINEKYRAYATYHFLHPAKDYLVRNHDIVDQSGFLIGAPQYRQEKLRSGTWSTLRYAWKNQVPLCIIPGDGKAFGPDWVPTYGSPLAASRVE